MTDAAKARAARLAMIVSLSFGFDAFALDRVHKYLQIEIYGWSGGEFHPVTPFLDYVLVWNPGVSYSLLTGAPPAVILVVMGVAMALIALWWWRADTLMSKSGLAIILGGALSHVIDRAIYGAVPDFFHLHWQTWSFYVFNLADAAITLGVVLLLLDIALARRPKQV